MNETPFANSCCISGQGITAELMALRLAQDSVSSLIIGGGEISTPAAHTVAIWRKGVDMLQEMNISLQALDGVYPIKGLCLVDEQGREDTFTPERAGLKAEHFGYNVPLGVLHRTVRELLAEVSCTGFVESRTEKLVAPGHIRLSNDEEIKSRLLIIAEGKDSSTAKQAGVEPLRFHDGLVAIICKVRHTRAHEGVSFEFYRPPGPLAFVPLNEFNSSIVWLQKADDALDDLVSNTALMIEQMNAQSHQKMQVNSISDTPKIVPLTSRQTLSLRAKRLALIGEAAHKMPPTGAQGMNLTLRDIDTLAQLVAKAYHADKDIGSSKLLSQYSGSRLVDNIAINTGVHLYNSSIRHAGPLAWARQKFQHSFLAKYPCLQKRIIRKALYGF